jgi:hypothetical protein
LRSSEESSERGRLRGGPSLEGAGEVRVDEEGEESKDGLTVVVCIADWIRVVIRGGVVSKRGTRVLYLNKKTCGDFDAQ